MRFKRILPVALIGVSIGVSACVNWTYTGIYKVEREDFKPPIPFLDLVSEVGFILRPFGFTRSSRLPPGVDLVVFDYHQEDAAAEYSKLSGANSRGMNVALDSDSSWITISDRNTSRETDFIHALKAALESGLQKRYGINGLVFQRLNDVLSFN